MRTIGVHTRVASFVAAVALLTQISPALATDKDDDNRPVEITLHEMGGDRTSSAGAAAPVWSFRRLLR